MVVACVILFLRAGFHLILEALSTSTLLPPGKEITFSTRDQNMHQEKKIHYGKFFDFCAEKCV